jgi:hypothetical protein
MRTPMKGIKMKFVTKVAITGLALAPVAFTLGVGIAAVSDMLDEKSKKCTEKTPPQTSGPKVEKIKNPVKRKKVYKQFEDIVNRY